MNKFSYKITLRKDRPLRTGDYPICLLLIYARRNKRISLNISVKVKDWDTKNQIVKKRDPDYSRKNKLLTIYKNRIASYETECIVKNKVIVLEEAVKVLDRSQQDEHSFYGYIKREWPNFEASLKPNTLKTYRSQLKILKSFKKRLHFSDINTAFLRSYETFLTTKRNNSKNTIAKSLKWIKKIINQAIDDQIIENSPFGKYKICTDPGKREHLTMAEIRKLEKLFSSSVLSPNKQESLRAFLFCCYTGLRLSDMKTLKHSNIHDSLLTVVMHKTELPVLIPLTSNSKSLLTDKAGDTVFNTVSDQMLNKHLHKIMIMVGIEKKITFHCARHTFATNSLNLEIAKDSVQKMLGHTNIKTTDIYTNYTVTHLKKEMKKWEKKSKTNTNQTV